MLENLLQMYMSKRLQNDPRMAAFNQMFAGKNTQQSIQTILNLAKSKGFDPDAKVFSENDLRMLGLKK